MKDVNRKQTAPLVYPRTKRNHALAVLTSMPAGKMVPLAAIPLLREDAMNGRIRVAVEMLETKELLMNPVGLRITAYCVPWLAFERFEGSRDQFDRSYMGQKKTDDPGSVVIPFFETAAMGAHGSNAVYKALGLHAKAADMVNTAYLEAYNAVWNFRAKNRSLKLTPRARLDKTLAPAFWPRSRFEHVKPDFDQAMIDGEVSLNVVNAKLPVKGIGVNALTGFQAPGVTVRKVGGSTEVASGVVGERWTDSAGAAYTPLIREDAANPGFPAVFAELAQNGITISLSNLELAKKTQAFAKMRERFEGHDDEYIIDMLMQGLTIPDQALKQPFLIADRSVRFAQSKRYAMDAGNLAESAVSGAAMVDVSLRVPRMAVGSVVMVFAEAVPEQLFERQRDPFFFVDEVKDLPEPLRDTLDPEKVDVIKNGEVDTDHSVPNGTFGFAPLNWRWSAFGPRIGGKFYRPSVNTSTDEERQRLWAVETVDPVLEEEFYIVGPLHQKPFLDTESEPFETTVVGNMVIDGQMVFGGMLVESDDNYDAVAAKAPTERIEKGA